MSKTKKEKQTRDANARTLPPCTVAPDPEHHRTVHTGFWDDETCNDSRASTFVTEQTDRKIKGGGMQKENEICEKISQIYPEIGECGIDVGVKRDEDKNAWIVDLKKDRHELTTYLNEKDAQACLEGKQCVNLGIQVAQLKANIQGGNV
jgi:hypothetical protein